MHRETPHDIHRVQRDLAAMQDALGTGYPFDRKTCAAWLAIAAVSALGAVAAWTGSATVAGVTGAGASAIVVAVMTWTVRAGGSRAVAPVAWREVRRVAAAKLVAGPIVAGFLLWQLRVGVPASYLISSTAFFVGVVVMVYATTSPWRRVGFGLAVPLLVFRRDGSDPLTERGADRGGGDGDRCRVVVCVHHRYLDAVARYVLGSVIPWDPSISTVWIRPFTDRCDSAPSPCCKPTGRSISRR